MDDPFHRSTQLMSTQPLRSTHTRILDQLPDQHTLAAYIHSLSPDQEAYVVTGSDFKANLLRNDKPLPKLFYDSAQDFIDINFIDITDVRLFRSHHCPGTDIIIMYFAWHTKEGQPITFYPFNPAQTLARLGLMLQQVDPDLSSSVITDALNLGENYLQRDIQLAQDHWINATNPKSYRRHKTATNLRSTSPARPSDHPDPFLRYRIADGLN